MITAPVSRDGPIARWLPVALTPVALGYGAFAATVGARHGPIGRPAVATAAELAAGWAVIGAGLGTWWRRPQRALGPLAVVAGIAWFAPDWIGWQLGPGVVRIVALATAGVSAAAVGQMALAGRARPLSAAIWTLTAAVGLGRALFYDAFADPHCFTYCVTNPLLVHGSRPVAVALDRIDAALAVLIAVATLAAAGARRGRALALPCALFACGWAVRTVALAVSPGDDPRRSVLVAGFAIRAVALIALAGVLAWSLSRARRAATALRRLVRAGSGSLEATLARGTGDRSLRLAFANGGAWIDPEGEPFAVPDDRALSVIAREGRPIAAIAHDPTGLDAATVEREIGPAGQLALENERLRAEARAQARELEASRVRIVEAGDAERRRLERDLHDGAQQRLVGLSMALTLARDAFAGDPSRAQTLERAGAELQLAIAELRELAHGIHPVELTDEGLAAALETLADRARVPVVLAELPGERLPQRVETAGYVLVDEIVRLAGRRDGGAAVTVTVRYAGDALEIDVDDAAASPDGVRAELVDVADRVHALGGSLTVSPGVHVHVELPCA
jgi:signal transduction histidine kinase